MDLSQYIPTDKFDEDAVRRAEAVGFPALDPVLPDLLMWIQDLNWPVARGLARLLAQAGPVIVPHIRAVLLSDDGEWKSSILNSWAEAVPVAVLELFSDELAGLAVTPTKDDRASEVDLIARALIARRLPELRLPAGNRAV